MPVPASYHHGNLREALVMAAIDVARESGPDGLALRDLARRVGVSHNAAYRHFADRDALVAEVAMRAMVGLIDRMQARLDDVPRVEPVLDARRRLAAIGRGYVEFALAEPGLFRVAFSFYPGVPDTKDVEEAQPDTDPFGLLGAVLDDLVAVGFLHPEARSGAEIMCWSAVHGFAVLHLDGPLSGEATDVRERSLDHLFVNIDRGYAATTGAVVGPGDLVAGS
ncbi:TetR/AcrR family transcriptional regulator [soil metagenome]